MKELDWSGAMQERVRIYRNLNNGRLSIQQKLDGRWIVTGHVTDCVIEAVTFSVSEAGRQRVIRDRRKNVHAWGEGILIGQSADVAAAIDLAYNPYSNKTFIDRHTGKTIDRCRYLMALNNRVFVSADAIETAGQKARLQITDLSIFQTPLWAAA
jgi:hypothetical protein